MIKLSYYCPILLLCCISKLYCQELKIDGPNIICPGQKYILETTNLFTSYRWSTGDTTSRIFIERGANYCITVTKTSGTKDSICRFVSEYNIEPLEILGDSVFCEGKTAPLDATSGFTSYLWSNNQTTRQILISRGGNYCVEAVNLNGCLSTACKNITMINRSYELRTPTICYKDTIIFNSFYLSDTGIYSFRYTKFNGCDSIIEFDIKHHPRIILDTISISKPQGFRVVPIASGGKQPLQYLWSNGDTNRILLTSLAGKYSLKITDQNGCTLDTMITLIHTNVDNQNSNLFLKNYKNPITSNELFQMCYDVVQKHKQAQISLISNTGIQLTNIADSNSYPKLQNGLYFLRIFTDQTTFFPIIIIN